MSSELLPNLTARSYLFAPGNSEKLVRKVFQSEADAIVLDLEDSVPLGEKERARDLVARAVAGGASTTAGLWVFVRVNALESGLTRDEIWAVVQPGLHGIRMPKVESAADVAEAAAWLAQAEARAGLCQGSIRIDCTIETARGVATAPQIAAAHPRVRALVFGHADFCLDIGVDPSPDSVESLYARSSLVVASRAAGLAQPIDGAYTKLRNPDGLRQSALQAKAIGFFGKSAIHPEQLDPIHQVFSPSEVEITAARALVVALEGAEVEGSGAVRLESGQFVDRAIARRARQILELAGRMAPGDKERQL